MPNYTKLFNSIVTSTIWTEDDKTRIVWITMLAMSDQNGEVHASIPGLARVAGVTLEDCELAIGKLLSPDPYSRTPDNQGRRIAPIDGGWELLNHRKYRMMASKEDEKRSNAIRQERFRSRHASVTDSNGPITHHNGRITEIRDIADTEVKVDSDSDSDSEKKKKTTPKPSPAALDGFVEFWQAYPKKQGKEPARKVWMRDRPDIQKVLMALEWQKTEDQWTKDGGQYIPLPATYLNAKRYDDENPNGCEPEPEYIYLDKMTPEQRMDHFRKSYPESDWPYIMEDGSLDVMAKMMRNREAKEKARREAEGQDQESTGGPELW